MLFRTVYTIAFSGTGLYFEYASKVFAGHVPYRDFAVEYPPLAVAFFALPRLFGQSFANYYAAWQVQIVICDLIALATLAAVARRAGEDQRLVLGAYTLLLLAVGPIVAQQFDLFPAALTLIAVWSFQRGRPTGGWIALTLGALAKLYPLLLIPAFAIPAVRRRDVPALRRMVITCAVTAVVALSPLLVIAPSSLMVFFKYHAQRGIQVESIYASILLALDKLSLAHVGLAFGYGAWNVTGTMPDILTPISTVVLIAAVGVCYVWIWRLRAGEFETTDAHAAGAACALIVTAALVSSKVLSPQYMIWLAPLLPLIGKGRRFIWPLFVLIGAATYYIFPANYNRLIFGDDGLVITVLLLRNLALIALGILLALSLRPAKDTP